VKSRGTIQLLGPRNHSPLSDAKKALLSEYFWANQDISFFFPAEYEHQGERFTSAEFWSKRERPLPGLDDNYEISESAVPIFQLKFDILEVKDEHGAYGYYLPSEKTVTLTKNSIRISEDRTHGVKVTLISDDEKLRCKLIPNNNNKDKGIRRTREDRINDERQKQAEYGYERFRPKDKSYTQAFVRGSETCTLHLSTSRLFEGQCLADIIYHHRMDRKILSKDTIYLLIMALAHALKEQVCDLGIVHRDIKPDNIIVDLDTMMVNIIDVESAFKLESNDHRLKYQGTPGFIAPEAKLKKKGVPVSYNNRTDIYALAVVIDEIKNQLANKDLDELVEEMKSADYRKRPSIDDVLKRLFVIVYKRGYATKILEQLTDAYLLGVETRTLLLETCHRNDFLQLLNEALPQLFDRADDIQAFIHGLNWCVLRGVNTREKLQERVNNIFDRYDDAVKQYEELVLTARRTLLNNHIDNQELKNELIEFVAEVSVKLKCLKKKPCDLNQIVKMTERLGRKHQVLSMRLSAMRYPEMTELGRELREKLANKKSIKLIQTALNQVYSTESAFEAFVSGLNWPALAGVKTKQELLQRAKNIFSDYENAVVDRRRAVKNCLDFISQLHRKNILVSALKNVNAKELNAFYEKQNGLVGRIQENRGSVFDLDRIYQSTQKINRKLQESKRTQINLMQNLNQIALYKALSDINPDSANQLSISIYLAICSYIKETYTQANKNKKDRAASDDRLSDIQKLAGLIKDRQEDKIDDNKLIQETEKNMTVMTVGFFGRSKLRNKVRKAIAAHRPNLARS